MRISAFIPRPQHIEHPTCDWCGTPMWLVTVEPHKRDHDKRTFECPECRNVVTEIVKFK